MATYARDWMVNALCRGRDPELYVTENLHNKGRTSANVMQNRARELCHGCPVFLECARDAIKNHDTCVVRAGVALSSVRQDNERRLQQVIDNNSMIPPVAEGKVLSDQTIRKWRELSCTVCLRPLRPKGVDESDWPGTVSGQTMHLCCSCYSRRDAEMLADTQALRLAEQRQRWAGRVCVKCDTPLRPRGSVKPQWPGCNEVHSHDICKPCVMRKAPPLTPEQRDQRLRDRWAKQPCTVCQKAMRPSSGRISSWPGTVSAHNSKICQHCHRKGFTPCQTMNDQAAESTTYRDRLTF